MLGMGQAVLLIFWWFCRHGTSVFTVSMVVFKSDGKKNDIQEEERNNNIL